MTAYICWPKINVSDPSHNLKVSKFVNLIFEQIKIIKVPRRLKSSKHHKLVLSKEETVDVALLNVWSDDEMPAFHFNKLFILQHVKQSSFHNYFLLFASQNWQLHHCIRGLSEEKAKVGTTLQCDIEIMLLCYMFDEMPTFVFNKLLILSKLQHCKQISCFSLLLKVGSYIVAKGAFLRNTGKVGTEIQIGGGGVQNLQWCHRQLIWVDLL